MSAYDSFVQRVRSVAFNGKELVTYIECAVAIFRREPKDNDVATNKREAREKQRKIDLSELVPSPLQSPSLSPTSTPAPPVSDASSVPASVVDVALDELVAMVHVEGVKPFAVRFIASKLLETYDKDPGQLARYLVCFVAKWVELWVQEYGKLWLRLQLRVLRQRTERLEYCVSGVFVPPSQGAAAAASATTATTAGRTANTSVTSAHHGASSTTSATTSGGPAYEIRQRAANFTRDMASSLSFHFARVYVALMANDTPAHRQHLVGLMYNTYYGCKTVSPTPLCVLEAYRLAHRSQFDQFLKGWANGVSGDLAHYLRSGAPFTAPDFFAAGSPSTVEGASDDRKAGAANESHLPIPSPPSSSSAAAATIASGTVSAPKRSVASVAITASGVYPKDVCATAVHDFHDSRSPACTNLAAMLGALKQPSYTVKKLLPTENPPERQGFGSGYVRLVPYCDPREVERLLYFMHAYETELDEDDTTVSPGLGPQTSGIVLGASLGTTIAASTTHNHRRFITSTTTSSFPTPPGTGAPALIHPSMLDPLAAELTLLISTGTSMRLQLSNPLKVTADPTSGYQCDTCCQVGLTIGYQAIVYEGVRSEVALFHNCHGFDVCMACAVHLYKAAVLRVCGALHPDPAWQRPFCHAPLGRAVVWTQEATTTTQPPGSSNEHPSTVVRMRVGVAHYGVRLAVWQVRGERMEALAKALAPQLAQTSQPRHLSSTSWWCEAGVGDYVELTDAVLAALPTSEEVTPPPATSASSQPSFSDAPPPQVVITRGRGIGACAGSHTGPGKTGNDDGVGGGKGNGEDDNEGDEASASLDESDVCPICLLPLVGPTPALRTRCGHWFHVHCIQTVHSQNAPDLPANNHTADSHRSGSSGSAAHSDADNSDNADDDGDSTASSSSSSSSSRRPHVQQRGGRDDGCPMCRQTNYLPDLTNAAKTIRDNVYNVTVVINEERKAAGGGTEAFPPAGGSGAAQRGHTHNATAVIAVATLLTDDGVYHNASNVASLQLRPVFPGQLFSYDEA